MRTKNWNQNRIFNGQRFTKLVAPKSKHQAHNIAKIQRQRGYNARITSVKDNYTGGTRFIVWRSHNKRRK